MATDVIETYKFSETLANSEKVVGTFVVDYSYGSTASNGANAPAAITILSENIASTGGISGTNAYYDGTFSQTNIAATDSYLGLSGVQTIGFSTTSSTGDVLNITFTDAYAHGNSGNNAEYVVPPGSGSNTISIVSGSETAGKTQTGSNAGTSSSTFSSGTIICYAKGTFIATEDAAVPVERLQEGDLVLTLSGDLEPVKWIGHRTVDCKRHPDSNEANPVRILKGAFSENQPSRDLFLSPLHSLYVNGIFVPAIDLVNDLTIFQEARSKITYYHVELASHNVIYAEGMTAETYLDDNNRDFFVTGADSEVVQLDASMPQMTSDEIWQNKGFAKVMREGAEVEAIRAQLLGRAALVLDKVEQKAA